MHFLLAAIGSIGDVVPILEVGRTLQQRGHDVQMLANPVFEKTVEKAGLEFAPAGRVSDQERVLSHPQCWSRHRGWTLWLRMVCVPTMRPMYEQIEQLHRPGETVLAYGWGCFGARIAQETMGLPTASIYLEPDKFRTANEGMEGPYPFMFRDWHPPWFRRFQYWASDRGFVDHFLFKVNRFRKELGLPHERRLLHRWWHGPDLALGLFPEWWGESHDDWPKQVVTTGFPYGELSTRDELTPELERFLDDGEPPVVFTPGALNQQTANFFEKAVEACKRLGCRAVLLGRPENIPGDLPDGVRHFPYAPFNALFPRSSVIVHRAGIGTSMQAMAAGKPQVVLPTLYLHHDTAKRMERLGISQTLSWKNLDVDTMTAAIQQMRESEEIRLATQEVASRIIHQTPIDEACDHLERLMPDAATSSGDKLFSPEPHREVAPVMSRET